MLVSSPERQNSLLLPKLVFGACPVLAVLGDISLLEHLQISFKLSLPNWDSQDWPLHYSAWPCGRVLFISENPSALVNNSCHAVGTAQRPREGSRFDSLSSKYFKGRRSDVEETFQNKRESYNGISQGFSAFPGSCWVWPAHHLQRWIEVLTIASVHQQGFRTSVIYWMFALQERYQNILCSRRLGNGCVFSKLDFHQRGLNVGVNRCCIVKSCCGNLLQARAFFLHT